METFRGVINGETIYYRDIEVNWEPVLLCDACEKPMDRSKSVFLHISTAFGKTIPSNSFEIHPGCFPKLVSKIAGV